MAFVYITTNLLNGKKYLGKHNGKNSNYLGSGTLLKKAIKKYGKENFSIEIIKECNTDEEAYELEKKLSLQLNVVENDDWYNMSIGGEGFSSGKLHPMFGIPKSEEHKIKLSKANIGKKVLEETKEKISLQFTGSKNPCFGLKGEKHPAYGHKKSEQSKKRISEKNKGRVKTPEEIEKFKKSRVGKGMGKNNSMSDPEKRKKVSDSKKGRKRIYREDGTFYMSPRIL
jgi:hypothetical protein